MPELPEVETTLKGLIPHVVGKTIKTVIVRNKNLRWPIPDDLEEHLSSRKVEKMQRRAKYLLWQVGEGWLVWHLGMSGCMRVVPADTPPEKHDHVDVIFENENCVRFTDPRRFGALLWVDELSGHPLLSHLGPEPLSKEFSGELLYQQSRRRNIPVKNLIMDNKVVVGVGNIYAAESLFMAGIHPLRPASNISHKRYDILAGSIRHILAEAIEQGGTTLKDFYGSDGKPGYFKQKLNVYGRGGQPCVRCGNPLKEVKLGQRATVYCGRCQR